MAIAHSIAKNLQFFICISNSDILSGIGNDIANNSSFIKQVNIIYHDSNNQGQNIGFKYT